MKFIQPTVLSRAVVLPRDTTARRMQLPMWHRYRVELNSQAPGLGMISGIRDKWGHELEFT